jgi:hypothetical protein
MKPRASAAFVKIGAPKWPPEAAISASCRQGSTCGSITKFIPATKYFRLRALTVRRGVKYNDNETRFRVF